MARKLSDRAKKAAKKERSLKRREKRRPSAEAANLARPQKKKEPVVAPVQKLKPKKKGLAALVEKDTILGKIARVATSKKTTAVLGTAAAALATGGASTAARAAAAGGRRAISATVSVHRLHKTAAGAEKLVGAGVRSAQQIRQMVGQPAKSGVDKLFKAGGLLAKNAPVAGRYATNAKAIGTTKSILAKSGMSLGAASLLVGAIGSYPFAGFIKEEALQTLGFAFNTAERNKDVEGMEASLQDVDDILSNAETVMDKIPYGNVLKQLRTFFEAAETKLNIDRRRLESLRGEQASGETEFQKERRVSDEAAFERKRAFGEEESERFEGIREETEEREAGEREEDTEFFEKTAEENRQRVLEQRAIDSQYFALIREGKFEEAEELLQSELKGGG